MSSNKLNELNDYLLNGIKSVNGWCIPQLWYTIWPVAQVIGDGPVAEIGVFEGKFFIGLCKTFGVGLGYRSAAIDVYDLQQFNLDGAGVGKLDVLKRNLEAHGISPGAVDFIKADSLNFKNRDADRIVSELGFFKFFSVDGCHEVVHTMKDVEFAMSVTASDGIIAVDDYTNADWPGVSEAIAKMYLLRDWQFVPMAVTANKLLLCSYSYHEKYLKIIQNYISEKHPSVRLKKVRRFGFDCLNVHPNWNTYEELRILDN